MCPNLCGTKRVAGHLHSAIPPGAVSDQFEAQRELMNKVNHTDHEVWPRFSAKGEESMANEGKKLPAQEAHNNVDNHDQKKVFLLDVCREQCSPGAIYSGIKGLSGISRGTCNNRDLSRDCRRRRFVKVTLAPLWSRRGSPVRFANRWSSHFHRRSRRLCSYRHPP